jgi:hypothetical protein
MLQFKISFLVQGVYGLTGKPWLAPVPRVMHLVLAVELVEAAAVAVEVVETYNQCCPISR